MGLLKSIKKRFEKHFLSKRYVESQFNELKWKINHVHSYNLTAASRMCSFQEISTLTNKDEIHNIAFVSILPPETSGIATHSLYSFIECDGESIDIFTKPVNDESFFINRQILNKKSTANIYHLDSFLLANEKRNYRNIIIAVGNSNHHFYIWSFLEKLKQGGLIDKVTIYVHDCFLHNIMYDGRGIDRPLNYAQEIGSLYQLDEGEIYDLMKSKDKWKLQKDIIDLGILGLRVFQSMGVSQYLVNSKAALKLVTKDIDFKLNPKVSRIFLPVLDNEALSRGKGSASLCKTEGFLYLGTFGVVSDAKCIQELIESVCQLNSNGYKIKLVVAGWHANEYMRKVNERQRECLIVIDSPSDNDLLNLMKSVDWAVQLRRFNRGESSGIVPMLLQSGIPTIVSRLGSFSEFGSSVLFFDNDNLPRLADFIKTELTPLKSVELKEEMLDYVQRHNSSNYCKELKKIC